MAHALKFKTNGNAEFSKVLKLRVREYFKESNQSIHANKKMVARIILLLCMWAGLYGFLFFNTLPVGLVYLNWALLGLVIAWVTINVGHDAIHGSASKHRWVNDLLSHTFNINGASAYMWKHMHNVAHHTYTNVEGYDEDISPMPIIRISPDAELKKIHRYQHIYSFFFYCLATLSWVFIKDYVKFFKNEVGNYSGKPHPRKEYFYLFFYKAINYTLFIVLPLIFMPVPWYHVLLGYLAMHAVSGFYLAIVFMLAHAVEETQFPKPDPTGSLENDWFVHQLCTTANFAAGSRVASFLTGGLNHQVEHHLFPHVCSIHYPALSRIVRDTTSEYNVPYYDIPTFWGSVVSHVRFLKKRGREEPVLERVVA